MRNVGGKLRSEANLLPCLKLCSYSICLDQIEVGVGVRGNFWAGCSVVRDDRKSQPLLDLGHKIMMLGFDCFTNPKFQLSIV
mgnify:CR=1 FL=1